MWRTLLVALVCGTRNVINGHEGVISPHFLKNPHRVAQKGRLPVHAVHDDRSMGRECETQRDLIKFIEEYYPQIAEVEEDEEDEECRRGGPCRKYLNKAEYRPLKIEIDVVDGSLEALHATDKEGAPELPLAIKAATLFFERTLSVIPSKKKVSFGPGQWIVFPKFKNVRVLFQTTPQSYADNVKCNNRVGMKKKYWGPVIVCSGINSQNPGWCERLGWENINRTEKDPDVLVVVRAMKCGPHNMADTIAYATNCFESTTELGRPTAFALTWCLEQMDPKKHQWGSLSKEAKYRHFLRVAIHEMAHGLGFGASGFGNLRNPDSEYRRYLPPGTEDTLLNQIIHKILTLEDKPQKRCPCTFQGGKMRDPKKCEISVVPKLKGQLESDECSVWLSLPKVRSEAQHYFDCSTVAGAPLTFRGGGHWLDPVLDRDVNSPSSSTFVEDMIVSRMTLAVFDGWYSVDYKMASPVQQGTIPAKGAGCAVATGKTNVPYTCPRGKGDACSPEHFGVMNCGTGKVITFCEWRMNSGQEGFGDAHGSNSRCLMTSMYVSQGSRSNGRAWVGSSPKCFHIECVEENKYKVYVQWKKKLMLIGHCGSAGETLTSGEFSGNIECADPGIVCRTWPSRDLTNNHPFSSNVFDIEIDADGLQAVKNAMGRNSNKRILQRNVTLKEPLPEELLQGTELIYPTLENLNVELNNLKNSGPTRLRLGKTTSLEHRTTIIAQFRHPASALPYGITDIVKEADLEKRSVETMFTQLVTGKTLSKREAEKAITRCNQWFDRYDCRGKKKLDNITCSKDGCEDEQCCDETCNSWLHASNECAVGFTQNARNEETVCDDQVNCKEICCETCRDDDNGLYLRTGKKHKACNSIDTVNCGQPGLDWFTQMCPISCEACACHTNADCRNLEKPLCKEGKCKGCETNDDCSRFVEKNTHGGLFCQRTTKRCQACRDDDNGLYLRSDKKHKACNSIDTVNCGRPGLDWFTQMCPISCKYCDDVSENTRRTRSTGAGIGIDVSGNTRRTRSTGAGIGSGVRGKAPDTTSSSDTRSTDAGKSSRYSGRSGGRSSGTGNNGLGSSIHFCKCPNGTPVTMSKCPKEGAHVCGRCFPGYHLETNDECAENVCKCRDGTGATGRSCKNNGDSRCKEHSCNPGYVWKWSGTCEREGDSTFLKRPESENLKRLREDDSEDQGSATKRLKKTTWSTWLWH